MVHITENREGNRNSFAADFDYFSILCSFLEINMIKNYVVGNNI